MGAGLASLGIEHAGRAHLRAGKAQNVLAQRRVQEAGIGGDERRFVQGLGCRQGRCEVGPELDFGLCGGFAASSGAVGPGVGLGARRVRLLPAQQAGMELHGGRKAAFSGNAGVFERFAHIARQAGAGGQPFGNGEQGKRVAVCGGSLHQRYRLVRGSAPERLHGGADARIGRGRGWRGAVGHKGAP